MLYGGLEAGGTKMVCAVGTIDGEILERASFPTRMPEETMADVVGFFKGRELCGMGVASFGPLSLDSGDPSYGSITTTPKPGWRDFPLRRFLMDALDTYVTIDTDVNAAAFAEAKLGAGKGLDSLVYYTVGTGVGGGAVVEGRRVHGLVHPEMGHILLRPDPRDPAPDGFCPFHKGCVEGLASGPAIQKRWGMSARELTEDHVGWDIEADYLAQLCANTILMLSPKRIVLGGGVMHQTHLFPRIRRKTLEKLNGYVAHPAILEHMDSYIVPPALGDNAGAAGALLLAAEGPL